jgi:hypothetical protein
LPNPADQLLGSRRIARKDQTAWRVVTEVASPYRTTLMNRSLMKCSRNSIGDSATGHSLLVMVARGAGETQSGIARDPQRQRKTVFVSSVISWEIAIKHSIGRLELPEPPQRFVHDRLSRYGYTALSVSHSHALRTSARTGYSVGTMFCRFQLEPLSPRGSERRVSEEGWPGFGVRRETFSESSLCPIPRIHVHTRNA